MDAIVLKNLESLDGEGKLNTSLIIWGVREQEKEIVEWLCSHGYGRNLAMVVDNFKALYYKEFQGISVKEPKFLLTLDIENICVLFAVNHSDAIRRQLNAYGIYNVYNLRNLSEEVVTDKFYRYNLPYCFTNRSKSRNYLCYILAGYESKLWDTTLARIEAFQNEEVDYCLVSSGKYDSVLEKIAEKNDWSYLYTEQNQVCYIQNLVIELHPTAEYIIKMDEDIFIGKDFFHQMMQEFHRIEECGEYRIGFAVPVIPLNCCDCISYLNVIGKKEEYEKRFGRIYRSRFNNIYQEEQAEFLWDTIENFDNIAERFLENKENRVLNAYYNIGCIMFTRDRWCMMGKWPEQAGENGMGRDEQFIYEDNQEKDLAIYEIGSVLAGHLAFGPQKKHMLKYYEDHYKKFAVSHSV